MLSIINRYLLKSLIKNGLIIFLTLNGIFLLMNFTKISARIAKFGVSFIKIFYLSALIIPLSAFQTISYVFFLSLLITLNSVFRSSELIMYKVTGRGYRELIRPIIIFTTLTFLASIILQIIFPISVKKYTDLKNFYNSNNILYTMKKNTFNSFNASTIIFKDIDKKDNIRDIIIIKKDKDIFTIAIAKNGEIGSKEDDMVLKLHNNKIVEINEDAKKMKISENKLSEIALTDHFKTDSESSKNKSTSNNPVFISTPELLEYSFDNSMLEEFHKRLIIPIQIFIIGFFCGLMLIKKNTPRVTSFLYDIFILAFFGYIIFFSQFIVPLLVAKNIVYIAYIHHFGLIFIFMMWLVILSDLSVNFKNNTALIG